MRRSHSILSWVKPSRPSTKARAIPENRPHCPLTWSFPSPSQQGLAAASRPPQPLSGREDNDELVVTCVRCIYARISRNFADPTVRGLASHALWKYHHRCVASDLSITRFPSITVSSCFPSTRSCRSQRPFCPSVPSRSSKTQLRSPPAP